MKGLRRLLLVAAATAGLALSLTGCSKTVDFLQYADVTFDGINGQATATVNVDYNKIGTDVFGTHKEYSEDDTIALHVKPSAPQDFAKKYALTRDTIEIPVKGAPKYIRSVDEVTQDVLDAVKPIAVARLEDSAGSDYNVHKESVFDADHNEIGFSRENVGEPRWADVGYMISWRGGDGERNFSSEYNDLFIPYEVEYIDDKTEETGTAVLGFWIKNVIIDSDGSVDVDGHANSITMTAYDSLEAFKKNEVDRHSNEYDIYEFPVNW